MSRRIVVTNHLTLDGVMQAPGGREEDTRGGFPHGGWANEDNDEVMGEKLGQGMATSAALLLGRRTYEHFYSYWPKQGDNPFTEKLNKTQKYVASTTLAEPLPWENSTLLKGDVPQAVAGLKEEDGDDIVVLGSGELIRSLMPHGLIDEYLLMIHPLVLGTGLRLFGGDETMSRLRLAEATPTSKGVILATYRPA
jgi:dihydrofolate reductase